MAILTGCSRPSLRNHVPGWFFRSLLRTGIHFLLLFLLIPSSTAAVAQTASEYQVKAAFLLNFAKFVTWPATRFSSENVIDICVSEGAPFGHSLEDVVNGKTVEGRTLRIRHLPDPFQSKDCEIVFIDAPLTKHSPALLREPNRGVLTVGESKDFAREGGIVNFVPLQNHIGFEINVDAADRAGLKISSKLLNLAIIVHDVSRKD